MTDIVERLRGFANLWLSIKTNCEVIHGINGVELTTDQLRKAADHIEALEAQLAARDAEIAAWVAAYG